MKTNIRIFKISQNNKTIDLWTKLQAVHMPIPSEQDFKNISQKFYEKWGFPHVLVLLMVVTSG